MIKELQQANQTIWYDDDRLHDDPWRCFDPGYWQAQNKVTGSAQGRGTTWFVQLDTMEAALRHYRRGGLFGKLVKDQYWFTDWQSTRSHQEFVLLDALQQANVNVPKPIAARAVKSGLWYRADLLSEKIQNAQDLVGILRHASLTQEHYQRIGEMIGRMHRAHVNHTDLNIHNILIDDQDDVWIIDFDKCGFASEHGEWKSANLERLKRSFVKEQPQFSTPWPQLCWSWLLDGYQAVSQ